MDDFKKAVAEFVNKIESEAKRNKRLREQVWKEIKDKKCDYCSQNGIIEYKSNSGVMFRWACDEFLIREDCKIRRIILKNIFGEPFVNVSVSKLHPEIRKFYKAYNFTKDLIITGSLGTGKTSLLALLYIKAKAIGLQRVWFKTAFHFQKIAFENRIEYLKEADVLLVDDLGTETSSKVFVSAFENVVDMRWRRAVPTIVTTNLNFDQLTELYPRAVDRLIQNGLIITLKGESRRRQK